MEYKNKTLTKWDKRYLDQAKFVSTWSKDKSTKTGVVVVNDDNTELVMGYNGFPRGADDNIDQRRYERPDKYVWTEHAERNAIYKAARLGISLNNCTMYATYFPCVECTRAIIQAGITKLYVEKPDFNHKTWGDSWVNAIIMFKECGVKIVWTNVCNYCDGDGYLLKDSGHPTHSRDIKVDCSCVKNSDS